MVYKFIPAQVWEVNEVSVEEDDPEQVDMPVIVSDKNQELKIFLSLSVINISSKNIIMLLSMLNNY